MEKNSQLSLLNIPETDSGKLALILDLIRGCGWKLGEFLLALFTPPPARGKGATGRTAEHSLRVQKFLNGEAKVGVGAILRAWTNHRDSGGEDPPAMFSLGKPYDKGPRSARAALCAYAAQTVASEMEKEMKVVTSPEAGLHVLEPAHSGEPQKLRVQWEDFGEKTVNEVSTIIQRFQPLTWSLGMHIATPKESKRGEGDNTNNQAARPPNVVRSLSGSNRSARDNI